MQEIRQKHEAASDPTSDFLVILSLEVDEQLKEEGLAREIINRVQRCRKKAGIHPTDPIEVFYHVDSKFEYLLQVASRQTKFIENAIGISFCPSTQRTSSSSLILSQEADVGQGNITISLARINFALDTNELKSRYPAHVQSIETYISTRSYQSLSNTFKESKNCSFELDSQKVELTLGKDIFLSTRDKLNQKGV